MCFRIPSFRQKNIDPQVAVGIALFLLICRDCQVMAFFRKNGDQIVGDVIDFGLAESVRCVDLNVHGDYRSAIQIG